VKVAPVVVRGEGFNPTIAHVNAEQNNNPADIDFRVEKGFYGFM
jgi:hypothetical protein